MIKIETISNNNGRLDHSEIDGQGIFLGADHAFLSAHLARTGEGECGHVNKYRREGVRIDEIIIIG